MCCGSAGPGSIRGAIPIRPSLIPPSRLDQCWDLLRQRRARLDQGRDPDSAQPNSAQQVEGYLQ
ncbi:DUF2630 family protein [Nocardia otitidiscaviarum]|uniref:DUF2630 family protein n=1 Tax=Nocardia otitidiscaviarum TaxID=1823 RepID=UPI003F6A4BD1